MPDADLAIRVQSLTKTFPGRDGPVHAVNGLDLEIGRGQCFGLLGPNGAGKTTTVEILEGLTEPTSGEVEVLGRRWSESEGEIRQRIGVTLQETRFPDKATVREIATLFRSFYQVGIEPDEALARVELTSKANAYVETLSGGQQRRLAVAIALVGDPELLFLDEPTTGLDPQSRRQLWDVIAELRERGRSILLTTHYMDEAERLCDRIAIVDGGQVIAEGTPAELISRIGGEHVVELAIELLSADHPLAAPESLSGLDSVLEVLPEGDGYSIRVTEPHRAIPALMNRIAEQGGRLSRLSTRQLSLEDVFVSLTGRHLRDDSESGQSKPSSRRSRRRQRAAG